MNRFARLLPGKTTKAHYNKALPLDFGAKTGSNVMKPVSKALPTHCNAIKQCCREPMSLDVVVLSLYIGAMSLEFKRRQLHSDQWLTDMGHFATLHHAYASLHRRNATLFQGNADLLFEEAS